MLGFKIMSKFSYVVAALIGFGLGIVASGLLPPLIWKTPESGEIYSLNSNEIRVLEERATNGDWLAAKLLMRHFGPYEGKTEKANRWLAIYIENRPEEEKEQPVRTGQTGNK